MEARTAVMAVLTLGTQGTVMAQRMVVTHRHTEERTGM